MTSPISNTGKLLTDASKEPMKTKDDSDPKLETEKKKRTSRLVIYINKVVFVLVGIVVGAAAVVLGTAVVPIVIAIVVVDIIVEGVRKKDFFGENK